MALDELEKRLDTAFGGPASFASPEQTGLDSRLDAAFGATKATPIVEEEEPGILTEGFRGLKRGVRTLGVEAIQLGAVGADIFGADEIAQDLALLAQEKQEAIQLELPRAVEFENAFDSPGNFVRFAASALGEQIPVVASIIGTGGIGGLVGRLVAKRAISKGAAEIALTKFGARGAVGGAVAGATAIETGATSGELFAATGEIEPGLSLASGMAKGALEAVVPLAFAKRFGLLQGQADDFLNRVVGALDQIPSRAGRAAIGAGGASIIEGTTETLQEAIDVAARSFVDENFDALSPETRMRFAEAAFTGALVGFIFGGVGGGLGPRGEGPQPLTETDIDLGGIAAGLEGAGVPVGEGVAPLITPVPGGETGPTPPGPPIGPEVGRPLPILEEDISQTLPPQATLVSPRQAAPGVGAVFESPDQAHTSQAIAQKRNTKLFRLDLTGIVLTPKDVTVDVFGLPSFEGEGLTTADMLFLQPENEVRALENVRSAMSAMEGFHASVAEGARSDAAQELKFAREFLDTATDLGFRYRPQETGGFKILKELPQEAFVEIDEVPISVAFTASTTVLTPGQALSETNGGFIFVPHTAFDVDDRAYSIDVEKLKREQVSSLEFSPEEQEQINAGTIPDSILVPPAVTMKQLQTFHPTSLIERGVRIDPRPGVPFKLIENVPLHLFHEEASLPRGKGRGDILPFVERGGFYKNITDFEGLTRLGQDPRLLTGYSPDKHKKGTVTILRGNIKKPGDIKYFKAAAKQLERLLKAMGLSDHRIILSDVPHLMSRGTYSNVSGAENLHIIRLSLPSQASASDKLVQSNTIFHEFGHLLTVTKLVEAGPAVQEALHNAFLRQHRAAVWVPYEDMVLRLLSSTRQNVPPGLKFKEGLRGQNIDNWWNFDEWIAEQTVRWSQTSRKALSIQDSFFRELSRALLKAFRIMFKRKAREAAAAPELQGWLDDLVSRGEPLEASLSATAAVDASVVSKEEHAEILNVPQDLATPEDQGAAREVKNAGDALLPPKGIVPENGADVTPRKKLGAELDRYNKVIKWGFSVLQLAKQNPHIEGLSRYVEHLRAWYNKKMETISRADTRVREWNALGKQQGAAVGKLLFDVDAQVYLEEGDRARWPTAEELAVLVQKHGVSEEGFKHYLRVVQDFQWILDQVQGVLEKDAHNSFATDNVTLARELNKIQMQMNTLKKTPYFPHSRFGDYTIVVRDSEGKTAFMQQFESKKARSRALPKVLKEFPTGKGFSTREDSMPKEMEVFRGLPPGLLQALLKKINPTEEQRAWIDAIIFEGTPAQSFKKRFVTRVGVPGFSDEALRSYANYFFHAANHIARIEFDGDLRNSITEVEADTGELAKVQGVNLDKRRGIIDFMRQHHKFIMTPQNDWATLRSAAFTWYLGFNASSALINLTQVPLVAYPYLAARFTDFGSLNELRKATMDLHKIYNAKKENIPEDEFWMIDLGIKQGWLDESQAVELAAISEGSNLARALPGDAAGRTIRQVGGWAAFMFQSAEKLNRRVVSRAAYRLAKQNPDAPYLQELLKANELQVEDLKLQGRKEPEILAYLAARDAVENTQFEYASAFRPQFMQGKKGVLFTFFMFQQQMLYYARFTPGRGRFLLALLATAGFMGLPGMEDLESLVNFMGRRLFGTDYNAEREARELMVELGIEHPDLLLHGTSRYGFGMGQLADLMGIPFPNVDLSARLSLGRIVPGLQEATREGDFDRVFTGSITDISGAAFNIPINVLRAMSDGHPDVFKRWERAMPTAIRNVSKMLRFYKEQGVTGRKGEELVDFDIHDPKDLATIAAQGVGFAPTELSQHWDRERMKQESLLYWETRKGMLFAQFDWARLRKDREAIADVRAAIRRYNNEVPDPGLRIGGRQLRQSLRGRHRARAAAEHGISTQRSKVGTARRINALFPETIAEEPVR